MKIYHLKTCDTCRKAIKAIQAAGHDPQLIDVRADGMSASDMDTIVKAVGWDALLNTRSTTWRSLDDAGKGDMDEAKAILMMGEHPTLIKRPVIMDGDKVTVGWKADQQAVWV